MRYTRHILLAFLGPAIASCALLIVVAACGTNGDGAAVRDSVVTPPTTGGQTVTEVAPVAPVVLFHGDTVVEQKILDSDVIVRATMASSTSEVFHNTVDYRAKLKFRLNVSEYLKGSGPTSIVAVWVDGTGYDTRAKAEARKARILASRDTQWDNREAVFFLRNGAADWEASEYALGLGHEFKLGHEYGDDLYSLHSERNRRWLPAAASAAGASSVDAREYLLDVPHTGGAVGASSGTTAPTISLGNLKKRIKEVTAEYNGGDGSEAYKECVKGKYAFERMVRHSQLEGDDYLSNDYYHHLKHALASGQPANSVLHQRENHGIYPDQKARTWLEGGDAALFSVVQGTSTPVDYDEDGVLTAGADGIYFTETFRTVRPLPAGVYRSNRKEVWAPYFACNYAMSLKWTVTVTAPAGTVHEAFFDPASTFLGVGASGGAGVISPASFNVGGVTTTITRIVVSFGSMVTMQISPSVSLSGKHMEFIKVDGTVAARLSFDKGDLKGGIGIGGAGTDTGTSTAEAAVSAAAHAEIAAALAEAQATGSKMYFWFVSSSPWKAGDKLMLRIR